MPRTLILLGNVVVLYAIYYLLQKLITNIHVFEKITWGIESVLLFFFAVAYSSCVTLIGSWVWNVILRGGGVRLSYIKTFIIYGQAQIGKYIPGNIFHFVGRAALGSAHGISLEPIVLSMGVETVVTLLSAIFIVVVGVLIGTVNGNHLIAVQGNTDISKYLFIFIAASICVLILSSLFPKMKRWLAARAAFFKLSRILLTISVNSTVFIAYGVILAVMQKNFVGLATQVSWYQFAVGFTVAWIAGYVIPGAPGGIGVREAVFVSLFSPYLGVGAATALAILVRIVMSLGDVIAYLSAYVMAKGEERLLKKNCSR